MNQGSCKRYWVCAKALSGPVAPKKLENGFELEEHKTTPPLHAGSVPLASLSHGAARS
jgi:hypothetical protein